MPNPNEIVVYFAEDAEPITCSSPKEMRAVLRERHDDCEAEKPICAMVEIPHFQINVGLGADPTFVMIHVEPYDGEYYMTVGDPVAEGDLGFYGCGNWTPFDRRNFIPIRDALAAVCEFVQNQRRSTRVRWENWNQEPA